MTEHRQEAAGKVALISGAASGIGAATATLLAARGASVVLVDRDERSLTEQTLALQAAGARVEAVPADVTSSMSCETAAARAVAAFNRLDVLVNNAGIGSFATTPDALQGIDWDRIIATNLSSVFLLTQACLPALRSAGGGCIVNVSSVHALATAPGVAPYAASKGGVLALTRALAIDLAPDRIRVVAVLPGAVDTPMLAEQVRRTGKSLEELGFSREETKLGRIGRPEEVAEVIAFAASTAASFITGSAIIADGGLLASL
jgi:NAD(P)-dependent dehydrogenase (short-subunit alcohol dehydrogenase family)